MLQLQHLHRSVGGQEIIHDLSLELKSKQALGLVGPNGCGKTSLINLINGFNNISSGAIIFDGQDISSFSVEQRANTGIGRVFQSFGTIKSLTVRENIALAYISRLTWYQRFYPKTRLPKQRKEEIAAILDETGLYEKRDHITGSLSGGQMRLVEIARLYVQDTKLFLLDEPTAGVSPKLKGTVIKLLRKIVDTGRSVLIVEHDMGFLKEIVDSFAVMESGQIYATGNYTEIMSHEGVKSLYL